MKCRAFVRVRRKADATYLISAQWVHNHPVDDEFVSACLRPDKETVRKIQEMTRSGHTCAEIRREVRIPLRPRLLYDIRRSVLKERQAQSAIDLVNLSASMRLRWCVTLHYAGTDAEQSPDNLLLISYVSQRFAGSAIAQDIVQMDDINETNSLHLPIFAMTFKDENGNSQILAFAIMTMRNMSSICVFLDDVRHYSGAPRVILVDRLRQQITAIQRVLPKTQIVVCIVHVFRTIHTKLRRSFPNVTKFFRLLVVGKMTAHEYEGRLGEILRSASRKRPLLQLLIDDLPFYDPMRQKRMRGQKTTNIVEGFFGVLRGRLADRRPDIVEVVTTINEIYQSWIIQSYREIATISPHMAGEAVGQGDGTKAFRRKRWGISPYRKDDGEYVDSRGQPRLEWTVQLHVQTRLWSSLLSYTV